VDTQATASQSELISQSPRPSCRHPGHPVANLLFRIVHFWWVNQNQTFRQETQGGYLWSPKRNHGDGFNAFFEPRRGFLSMRL